MKTQSILPLFVLTAGLTSLSAAPQVANSSFEELYAPLVVYGDTPVPRWTIVGRGGLNHLNAGPFANNGTVPQGAHVVYIQSFTQAEAPAAAPKVPQLLQDVLGFEAGKTYVVNYHCNSRAGAFAVPLLTVTLGGVTVVPEHPIPPVEGDGQHSLPYRREQSEPFQAAAAGTLTLNFSMRHPGAGDSALLLDGVEIVELGTMRLLSARRRSFPETEVLAQFSSAPNPSQAQDPLNYRISNGIEVVGAILTSDPKVVLLQTSSIDEASGPYDLDVIWLRDAAGLGMQKNNSSARITIPTIIPPTLQISKTDSFVAISWPATEETGGFNLETTSDLASPFSWQPIAGFPEIQQGRYVWTELSPLPAYYRLRR